MTGGAYLFNERDMHQRAYLQMIRLFRISSFVTALAVGAAACASSWPAQRYEVVGGSVTGDSAPEGGPRDRFSWHPGGELALTNGPSNVWVYARQ
jgi:hypothetical protein